MADKPRRFSGKVVKRVYAAGSKSEHVAVTLDDHGTPLKMRRLGGNPFFDAELEKLVGKSITAEGTLLNPSTVLLSSWQEVDDGEV